ncbi:MAG TPA: hypothetical protein VG965_05260 [Patescibacteria group bacterium]|nr:hypothetical protein [Patescibacteria group bacterium]
MRFKLFLFFITAIFIVGISSFFYSVIKTGESTSSTGIIYTPQQISKINIEVGHSNQPFTLRASMLPEFIFNLVGEKFNNLWTAHAAERTDLVSARLVNAKGDIDAKTKVEFDEQNKYLVVLPYKENKLKPGLYTLTVTVKSSSGDVTTTQDFSWGVMAINTNKSVYTVGERVEIGMAVLGDYGNTKCIANGKITFNTAKVWLTVTSPSGVLQKFSTDEQTIHGSPACGDRTVTNSPDFFAELNADQPGTYTIHMEAEHIFGKRQMDYAFRVESSSPDFDLERTTYPTRIYPKVNYPVQVTIKANRDYSGLVRDFVPKNFQILQISNLGIVSNSNDAQQIQWQVNWKKGQVYTLSYTIHFPPIAPELYLIGPFTIGEFKEDHQWKIASDSIFQFIQESHHAASGTSVSTTFADPIGQSHLVLKICYRTTSSSFSSQSGWTTAYNNSSGPRIYMFYRVAPAGMSQTVTCSTTSSGVIAVQALEFSGNSTSSVRDQRNRLNNSSTCNSGTHQNTNSNLTPGNPDVLVVSAFSATSTRTVTDHLNYADTSTGFNGSSGTFDSSWSEIVNNPPSATQDAITYSAGGGTCDNLQVSFNPSISVSQGGYRFFENADNVNPGGPLAGQGVSLTFTKLHNAFRLRILLEIDSPSGSIIDIDSGDWQLEYAEMPQGGDCSQGVYNPVDTVANGTPIAFNSNPNSGGNNAHISSSGSDPVDAGYTNIPEDYIENWLDDSSEDITNDQSVLSNNRAGLFDFSLIDNTDGSHSHTYCLAVFNGDGSNLDAYKNYPTITTPQTDVLLQSGTTITGGTSLQ